MSAPEGNGMGAGLAIKAPSRAGRCNVFPKRLHIIRPFFPFAKTANRSCHRSELPAKMQQLVALTELSLSGNRLESLPKSFGALAR